MRRIISADNIESVSPRHNAHYQRHRRVYQTPYAARRAEIIDLQCQLAEASEIYANFRQQRMASQMPQTESEIAALMHLWSEEERMFRVMMDRIANLEEARKVIKEHK